MVTEHTPGPVGNSLALGMSTMDGTMDEMSGLGWEIDGPPEPMLRGQFAKAADAHLIAASPEMLAALERVKANAIATKVGASYLAGDP